MNLDMKALQEAGAFAGAPVEKEIEWDQGGSVLKMTTFVRRLSYKAAVSEIKTFRNMEGEDQSEASSNFFAARIAACICDAKGNPVFTVQDITGDADPSRGPLNYNLTMALLGAIREVNDLIPKPKA